MSRGWKYVDKKHSIQIHSVFPTKCVQILLDLLKTPRKKNTIFDIFAKWRFNGDLLW